MGVKIVWQDIVSNIQLFGMPAEAIFKPCIIYYDHIKHALCKVMVKRLSVKPLIDDHRWLLSIGRQS